MTHVRSKRALFIEIIHCVSIPSPTDQKGTWKGGPLKFEPVEIVSNTKLSVLMSPKMSRVRQSSFQEFPQCSIEELIMAGEFHLFPVAVAAEAWRNCISNGSAADIWNWKWQNFSEDRKGKEITNSSPPDCCRYIGTLGSIFERLDFVAQRWIVLIRAERLFKSLQKISLDAQLWITFWKEQGGNWYSAVTSHCSKKSSVLDHQASLMCNGVGELTMWCNTSDASRIMYVMHGTVNT